MVPFAGLAFLWFMAVIRHHIGLLEDQFFATVFRGSGFLFVLMLFAAMAVSRGMLDNFASGDSPILTGRFFILTFSIAIEVEPARGLRI